MRHRPIAARAPFSPRPAPSPSRTRAIGRLAPDRKPLSQANAAPSASCSARFESNAAESPSNTAQFASHPAESYLPRPQSPVPNTARFAANTAESVTHSTLSHLIQPTPLPLLSSSTTPLSPTKQITAPGGGWRGPAASQPVTIPDRHPQPQAPARHPAASSAGTRE
jgi:hypothetical protein